MSLSLLWVFMLFLCSFGFGCKVIRKRRGVHRTKGQGGVVAGKSVSDHYLCSACQRGAMDGVQRYSNDGDGLGDRASSDAGVTEVGYWTGSIYSGDPGVDCIASCNMYRRLHPILSLIILLYNELRTPSFPSFDFTCSFWDVVELHNCMDPHGRVVSYYLTLFPCSLSQNNSFWQNPIGCGKRCGGVLKMGTL